MAILAPVLAAPETFVGGVAAGTATTAKAVGVGAVFSVVGAATVDSLF